jgi:hypothetical protein
VEQDLVADDMELWRRRKRRASPAPGRLLLAPVCTWFTMLVLFQMAIYDPGPILRPDLVPPLSTADHEIVPAISLLVSKTTVLVDSKPVAHIVDGHLVDPETALPAVRHAFLDRATGIRFIADRGGLPFDGNLLVIADRDTPFGVLQALLTEAARSDFEVFELVVQQGG